MVRERYYFGVSIAGSTHRQGPQYVGAAPSLAFGHIGGWHNADESGRSDETRSVAVELDMGGAGGSVVIFVSVPARRDGSDFRPDDDVRLVISEAVRSEISDRDARHTGLFGTRPTGVLPFS